MSLIRDSLKKVQEKEETLDQTAVAADPKTGSGPKGRQSVYILLGAGLLVMAAVYFLLFQASPRRPAQPQSAGGGQGQPGAATVPGPAAADPAKASPESKSATLAGTASTVTTQAAGPAVARPANLATLPPSKVSAMGSEGAGAIPPGKAGVSPKPSREQGTSQDPAGPAPQPELRKEKAARGAEPRSAATATPSSLPGRGIEIDSRTREDLKKAYEQAYNLQQEGKWDLAQARYREILAQDPYNPYVLTNLGLLYQKTGRLKEAVSYYEKALEADPRFVPAMQNLGVAWIRLGNGEEATRWLERSLALDPDNAAALANLGTVSNKKGNREMARQYWKRSLDLDPRVPEVSYNLARLEEEAGNSSESYRYYQQFIRLRNDPSDRLVQEVQRHIRDWKVPGGTP
jgi:tetratricopeptide (TPR) repeat protein